VNPVVVLTPDLSSNATGRAILLADLLTPARRVTIAGPSHGHVWSPIRDRADLDIVELARHSLTLPRELRRLARSATIVAVKPLFSSFGTALATRPRGPLVLDIDDPELALTAMDARTLVRSMTRLDGPVITSILIRMRGRAERVSVSNLALQAAYGGTIIPHARDERFFDGPLVRDRPAARAALGIGTSAQLIVFVGTIRPHKGVDVLVESAQSIPGATIVIVGAERRPRAPANVLAVPPTDYRTAMRWLAASDIVVVPQRDGPIGRRQAPAKIIDAMAMGRAVVASDLAPIREMLGETGVLVTAGSATILAEELGALMLDHGRRQELERIARSRFLERYSFGSVRPRFVDLVGAAEAAWHP
jgi:glycosyltransferase involved in cell wall biosynthesis